MIESYSVYMHTTPNNKVYIGITKQEPKIRWSYGNNYRYSKHFYRAIKKYGWKNIKHEILFENLSKEEACKKEIELIKLYDSTNHKKGYNVSTGGEAPYGVKFTDERKAKISKAQKGRKHTPEHISKLPQIWKNGHIPWNKGVPMDEETKIKLMNRKSRIPVICIETNAEYNSIREASRKTNISVSHIAEVCKKIRKTAGGYHWQYIGGVQ